MRFYNQRHKLYCGIALHARKMYICIIDAQGKTKLHQNFDTDPALLFDAIFPYLEDVVIYYRLKFLVGIRNIECPIMSLAAGLNGIRVPAATSHDFRFQI